MTAQSFEIIKGRPLAVFAEVKRLKELLAKIARRLLKQTCG
jgi:hypothetical protein